MRETIYVNQNKDKWATFEKALKNKRLSADQISELFIQVTDDLSYARTFYHRRSVRVYLNGLAQNVFFLIYKSRKPFWRKFKKFWTHQLPSLNWISRKSFYLSFSIFSFATLIGLLSASADLEFTESILGDNYVQMTEKNIAKGDPMAVYKMHGEFEMFLGITLNNIFVASLTFVLGLLFAVGTIAILIRNGIMFGTFLHLFLKAGLIREAVLTVMIHGTLELSSIVIAGAAGLTMGSGLVFPGSYTRMNSLQLSARRGINLFMGSVPIFVIAAFLESYFTRHTEASDLLRAFFIILCLVFVFFYFLWYPRYLAKNGQLMKIVEKPVHDSDKVIHLDKIKSTGDIYHETFVIVRSLFGKVLSACLLGSIFFCAGVFLTSDVSPPEMFLFPKRYFGAVSVVPEFFHNHKHPYPYVFWVLSIGSVLTFISWHWFKNIGQGKRFSNLVLVHLLLALIFGCISLFNNAVLILLGLFFAAPFVFFTFYTWTLWGFNPVNSLAVAWRMLRQSYLNVSMLSFTLLITSLLLFLLLDSGLTELILDSISIHLNLDDQSGLSLMTIIYTGLTFMMLTLTIIVWYFTMVLQYHSCYEIISAEGLKKQLLKLATARRIRGFERE